MIKDFKKYITESNENDYKVGDTITVNGKVDDISFHSDSGIIVYINPNPMQFRYNYSIIIRTGYLIRFFERFSEELHNGHSIYQDTTDMCYYVPKVSFSESKRIYSDLDPYGSLFYSFGLDT